MTLSVSRSRHAEFFNLFNLCVSITGNGSANFYSAIVNGVPQRNGNAGETLYDVGPPRQIQLALKLTF